MLRLSICANLWVWWARPTEGKALAIGSQRAYWFEHFQPTCRLACKRNVAQN